jgi:hypothetical protein
MAVTRKLQIGSLRREVQESCDSFAYFEQRQRAQISVLGRNAIALAHEAFSPYRKSLQSAAQPAWRLRRHANPTRWSQTRKPDAVPDVERRCWLISSFCFFFARILWLQGKRTPRTAHLFGSAGGENFGIAWRCATHAVQSFLVFLAV